MKNILLSFLCAFLFFSLSSAQEEGVVANETQPVFAKGKMSLDEFLKIYLQYPAEAMQQGTQGTVMVSLDVAKDGEPLNPKVLKSVDPLLDAEALRVVGLFPYFTPASKDGVLIKSKVTIPIQFGMSDGASDQTIAAVESGEKFPLYVIDGSIVNDNINVNAEEIESIRVMKGKKAIEKFGDRAIDGAIIITTKRIKER